MARWLETAGVERGDVVGHSFGGGVAQTMLLEYEHDLHRFEATYGTAAAEIDRLIGRPFAEEMP
jgi:pimeloyl-ACP methyl ester carboxylesterase